MTASILPANLADLERDLDAALSRIELVEIPIAVLWNPWACPLDVLPYLAWAVSVDQWRSDWPEQTKRRVVAESIGLHRLKGTRQAVEKSMRAVGSDAVLKEWFEVYPPRPRGTFSLEISSNFKSPEEYEELIGAVVSSKNTRSHLEFIRSHGVLASALLFAMPVMVANNFYIGIDATASIDAVGLKFVTCMGVAKIVSIGAELNV